MSQTFADLSFQQVMLLVNLEAAGEAMFGLEVVPVVQMNQIFADLYFQWAKFGLEAAAVGAVEEDPKGGVI